MSLPVKKTISFYLILVLVVTASFAWYLYMPQKTTAAVAFAHLTDGADTTNNPATTASIAPTANAQVFVTVAVAVAGGGTTHETDDLTVTGNSITYTEVARTLYNRRAVYVFRGTSATPSAGALTLTFTSGAGATFTEFMWSVDEATGVDSATPIGAAFENTSASATSLSVTVSETPDTGDYVFAAFGVESGVTTTLGSELDTTLVNRTDGSDVRTITTAYDSVPDASPVPGISWTGSNSASGIAFIINVGAAPAVGSTHVNIRGGGSATVPNVKIRGGGAAGSGSGSVTYDNATNGVCGPSGLGETPCTAGETTLTFSHTTGSSSNRAIAVGCTVAGGSGDVQPNISTVTYGGVSLSQLAKRDANYDTYIWTLPNGTQPTSGANNVVVTAAGDVSSDGVINCVAITASGVDQTNNWTVSDCTGAGSGTTASCTLGASGANDLVVVFECNGTSIGSPSATITRRSFHDNTGGTCNSFGGGTAPGGTTALSWNNNGNDTWQILAAAFKAVGLVGSVKFR